jgi:hypothetical protein
MVYGFLALVLGVLYGWLAPGRQDKGHILKMGLLIGLILAIVLALLGLGTGASPIGFGEGFLGAFLSVLIITLLFILGVWLGDAIEGMTKKRRTA